MDDPAQKTVAERTCTQCGTRAGAGLIFCKKCGAALRTPAPLIQSGIQDDNSPPNTVSPMKRTAVTVIKTLAAVAAVGVWLCPLRTGTQVLLFVASIAVLLICHFFLTELDETYAAKGPTGYWPKPGDWNAPPKTNDPVENRTAAQTKR